MQDYYMSNNGPLDDLIKILDSVITMLSDK